MAGKYSFEDLLRLAHDKSVGARAELVNAVSDLYFEERHLLAEQELALASDILRRLIHDVEMSIRCALAERLARHDDAPDDLIRTLANDTIEVAHPILVRSRVLHDNELISIIHHRSMEHRLAIAMRFSVSAPVSEALVETGDEGVLHTLLENPNSEISNDALGYLVEKAERMKSLQQPLLKRQELSEDLARKMYWWVSAALRQHIVDRYAIDPDTLDDVIEAETAVLIEETQREREEHDDAMNRLVERIWRSGKLSPKFLIQTLREGEVPLFDSLFAKMVHLGTPVVRRVIYQPGGHGLAICCRAVEIEKADFASLFLLSRQGRPGDQNVESTELTRALTYFDTLDQNLCKRVIKRWRSNPDYRAAIDAVIGEVPDVETEDDD